MKNVAFMRPSGHLMDDASPPLLGFFTVHDGITKHPESPCSFVERGLFCFLGYTQRPLSTRLSFSVLVKPLRKLIMQR